MYVAVLFLKKTFSLTVEMVNIILIGKQKGTVMRFTLYETLNGHRDKFLAKIAGCTDFHFSRMINGHKQIADEYVERLADYFGVPKEKMEYALRSLREERIRRASKS